jgi:hypothetical protein
MLGLSEGLGLKLMLILGLGDGLMLGLRLGLMLGLMLGLSDGLELGKLGLRLIAAIVAFPSPTTVSNIDISAANVGAYSAAAVQCPIESSVAGITPVRLVYWTMKSPQVLSS